MDQNEEHFQPEEVEEQIERQLRGPGSLPQALQHLYKDDLHRLEQIRERLTYYEQFGKKARPPVDIQRYQQRKLQSGQYEQATLPARRRSTLGRRLNALLAGLVAAVIIVSVLAFSTLIQQQQAHYTVTQRDLFINNGQSVVHIDAVTKKVYWQYHISDLQLGTPVSPVVADNIVYAESQDGIYAIDAATGTLRWSYNLQISPFLTNKARLVLSGGSLYVPDINKKLYQFNAIDGTLTHTFSLHLNTSVVSIAVENGILYANGIYDICAIRLTDGQQLWYKVQNMRLGTPHILNGIIYLISTSDVSWPSPQVGISSFSYINAFDTNTGNAIWQSARIPATVTDIALNSSVIFVGATDGSVSAFSEQGGVLIWSKIMQGVSFSETAPQLDAGIVYLAAKDARDDVSFGVIAIDAANGRIRWQYPHSAQEMMSAGHNFGPPLVVQGVVYVIDSGGPELYAIAEGAVLWHIQAK